MVTASEPEEKVATREGSRKAHIAFELIASSLIPPA
jgi:hypothetical protein